jgi:tRNA dimethylallyltransferase
VAVIMADTTTVVMKYMSATIISTYKKTKGKLVVILGPTSSGKSNLAVELAKKYSGEIISADSRQVYKGLDIGSGKITKTETKGVPHHLIDVVQPFGSNTVFTVADFKKLADEKVNEILKRGNLPILCGGTGFYIQAIVDNVILPEVPPNKSLRLKLEKYKTEKLFETLSKLDPKRAKNIDAKNRPRLIRAIEIAKKLGKVPKIKTKKPPYKIIQIGIKTDTEKLHKKIHDRLIARMKKGMLNEARKLNLSGMSWKRMENLGLEYRYLALHLQKKISRTEMLQKLEKEILKYAKRQATWFKKDKRIKWFTLSEKNKIWESVQIFLK